MGKFGFYLIIEKMRDSLLYLLIGALLGSGIGSFLFAADRKIIDSILSFWFKRMMFGLEYVGNDYRLWFILNNLMAFLMIIIAIFLIIFMFMKKKKFGNNYFKSYEEEHPIITLYSLYMMPIGALIINGALVSLFLTFTFLDGGFVKFSTALSLMMPHGLNEFIALILASSYGLAFIQTIEKLVLKKKWKEIRKISKKIFLSQITLLFIIFIIILVFFGGIAEGTLSLLLK